MVHTAVSVHAAPRSSHRLAFAADLAERAIAANVPDLVPRGERPLAFRLQQAKRLVSGEGSAHAIGAEVLAMVLIARVQQGIAELLGLNESSFTARISIEPMSQQ